MLHCRRRKTGPRPQVTENFREVVFEAFSYFEPMETAKDGSGMPGFRIFNNSTCDRVLDLLEAGYMRLGNVLVKRITVIEFGVNDGGGNGRGCFGIEVRADTWELTNMITAGFEDK